MNGLTAILTSGSVILNGDPDPGLFRINLSDERYSRFVPKVTSCEGFSLKVANQLHVILYFILINMTCQNVNNCPNFPTLSVIGAQSLLINQLVK